MADKKISALTGATTPLAGTEVLPIVQSGSTVKVAVSDLTAGRAVATGALAVTGTLSATSTTTLAAITSTVTAANNLIVNRTDNGPAIVIQTNGVNKGLIGGSGANLIFSGPNGVSAAGEFQLTTTGLAVTGTLSATNDADIGASGSAASKFLNIRAGTNLTSGLRLYAGAGATLRAQLSYDDNSGATTLSSPSSQLVNLALSMGSIQGAGTISGGTSGTGYSFSGSAPATSLTLNSSGNLGVGVAPVSQNGKVFHIDGGAGAADIRLTNNATGSTIGNGGLLTLVGSDFYLWNLENNFLSFGTNNLERVRIDSSGIVTMNAYGVGTATFSATGVISSVSDETWKIKDGVPTNPDAMLKKLEPGYWYYNDEKKETFGTDRQLGFYAQNVNVAIGPEAAPEPEEGKPWGYYDRSVLAITVMSLQKALATIELLTARVAQLESKP